MPADDPASTAAPDAAAELTAMREERDKFKDQLLRTAADFENFRKRSRKDVEEAERKGKVGAIEVLLPVIDNLERAVAAASAAKDVAAVVDGVKMVLRLFEDQASSLGMTRIPTVGERFDPSIHDAIQQKETDEHPPSTVVAEIVAGWRLGEKLVRPAMVVVAKKPTASA
jgi:molecular chaperone GrpE